MVLGPSTRLSHAIHVVAQYRIDARLIAAPLRLEEVEQVFVELDRDRLLFGLLGLDKFPELVIECRMIGIAARPFLDFFFTQVTDTIPVHLGLDRTESAICLTFEDSPVGAGRGSEWVSHGVLAP